MLGYKFYVQSRSNFRIGSPREQDIGDMQEMQLVRATSALDLIATTRRPKRRYRPARETVAVILNPVL